MHFKKNSSEGPEKSINFIQQRDLRKISTSSRDQRVSTSEGRKISTSSSRGT
jgi:hypothetical protein